MCPRRFWMVSLALAAALVACGVGPSPVSRDPHDPSSPGAGEGVDPLRASGRPAAIASAAAPAEGATYVCPMHPEVISAAPGSCPKCNMSLVPKK
ncbi:MAG: hypothetical protein JST00_08515 [Deltaproteobacteria bacterium]|nr:hypothetical protein [Deltaproteobacteria bacterium]